MIATARLQLIPASSEMVKAALEGPDTLAAALGASVPSTWPPEYLDAPALRFTLDRLEERPEQAGWWLYFVVLPAGPAGRTLIGSAGYKGPPTPDGSVEVGYGIVSDHRRRGYASEVTRGLLSRAFASPGVRRAVAETLPELVASIGVLRACGFHLQGEGSEPGVVRFELSRAEFEASGGTTP
jgi:RimJ/RimL family protein N-acetyltransferase